MGKFLKEKRKGKVENWDNPCGKRVENVENKRFKHKKWLKTQALGVEKQNVEKKMVRQAKK